MDGRPREACVLSDFRFSLSSPRTSAGQTPPSTHRLAETASSTSDFFSFPLGSVHRLSPLVNGVV